MRKSTFRQLSDFKCIFLFIVGEVKIICAFVTFSADPTYDEIWLRFFRDTGASSEEIDMLLGHTFNLLRGMTLQRVFLKDDPKHDEKLLASWSKIMNSCLLEKRAYTIYELTLSMNYGYSA